MKRYSVPLLVFLILSACSNSGGGPSVDPDDDTRIVFVNGNDFGVTVYSDSNRTVKLAKASAAGESESVEAVPNSAAVFYLTYHILIDGQEFLYNYDLLYRIDAEKTNRVIIEDLSKLDPAELGKSLIAGVRIKIQNSGTSSLVLMRNNIEEKPQGADSSIIIPGETALYEVTSGSVSSYSFMRNSAVPIAFPAGLTDFVPGRLYSFKFDGNNLTLLEDIPLTIAQALKTVIKVPAGLKVTGQTKDSISLSWEAVSGVDGYSVTRSGGSGGPSTKTTASTSYTDTGLTPDTTYSYEVTAYKGSAQSAPAAVSGKTIAGAPQKPTGLVVSDVTAGSVSLSWNSTAGAASYEVYRINYTSGVSTKIGTTPGAYYTDYAVNPGTAYYYSVGAVNTAGSSPNSDRAFVYAANHNALTTQAQSLSVSAGSKQYFRLPVSAGKSYTITTSASLYHFYIQCTAWQNDGTQPFSYTLTSENNSETFTSTAAGYITVEIANSHSYNTISYQIYYQEN
jgi:chitodextrinase